jgi:ribosomal protein L16/L10AE
VLYPKRIRFHKYKKGRFKGCKVDGTQLCFGKYGMESCKVGRISYQAIEAMRRIISRKF